MGGQGQTGFSPQRHCPHRPGLTESAGTARRPPARRPVDGSSPLHQPGVLLYATAARGNQGRVRPPGVRPAQEGVVVIRRGLLIGLGGLVTVAGVVFALQGFGYIGGSSMTGTTLWAVLGPLIAILGVAIVAAGVRVRRR